MKFASARTGELHFVRVLGQDRIILTVGATLVGHETFVTAIEFTTTGHTVGLYKTKSSRLSRLDRLLASQ